MMSPSGSDGLNGTAILTCRGVTKSFGGVHALSTVDLSVGRGEIVGLAGSNGAGKTTLLNTIGGQLRLDSGEIVFDGEHIDHLAAHQTCRRGIARTFQGVRVFSTLTSLQNVALAAVYGDGGSRISFGSRHLSVALDALSRFSLEERAQEVAGALSVYEQKRLMLACAMVKEPRLLMLDEPVGGLSVEEGAEMVRLCRNIGESGGSVLVVEHIMSFLTAVADRVVVLHEGKNLAEGTPAEITVDPRVRSAWLGETDPEVVQ